MAGGDLCLRRAEARQDVAAAVALAKEYGRWAVQVAKVEYGIDAAAESEQGLSTSIGELLQSRGRLYLAGIHGATVGLGGLKPISEEVAETKRMYVRPCAVDAASADGSFSD